LIKETNVVLVGRKEILTKGHTKLRTMHISLKTMNSTSSSSSAATSSSSASSSSSSSSSQSVDSWLGEESL
jgi:hypothetical protein